MVLSLLHQTLFFACSQTGNILLADPVSTSDTTYSWKLTSRRQEFHKLTFSTMVNSLILLQYQTWMQCAQFFL